MKKKTKVRKKTASRAIVPPDCKQFTGYKPCFPGTRCYEECVDPHPFGTRILIINLDAMGNVLVTTSILPAIKRKFPTSTITWITEKGAMPLLYHIPLIDRLFPWEPESWLVLAQMRFDVVYNVDKSRRSGAFAMAVNAKSKLGFGMNADGQIVPLNTEARENYLLGLDDHLKFRVNRKSVSQLQCEEFRLDYRRDAYQLRLSPEEEEFCKRYRQEHALDGSSLVVGLNTGCSELYPNKKMTVDQHVELIGRISQFANVRLLLVGGPEDTLRNAEISRRSGDKVLSTPTTEGLRRGVCYVNLCNVIVTGDSLGMHMAIALGKQVIVWFGVSCHAEIDLYERGIKLIPEGLECSPCWKRECPFSLECIQMIDLNRICDEVLAQARNLKSRPPSRPVPIP